MFTAGVRADDQVYVHRRLSDQELLYFFGWIYFSVKKTTNKQNKRSEAVEGRARRQLRFKRKTGQNPGKKKRIRRKISLKGRRGLSLQCSFPLNWSRCFEKGGKASERVEQRHQVVFLFLLYFLVKSQDLWMLSKRGSQARKSQSMKFLHLPRVVFFNSTLWQLALASRRSSSLALWRTFTSPAFPYGYYRAEQRWRPTRLVSVVLNLFSRDRWEAIARVRFPRAVAILRYLRPRLFSVFTVCSLFFNV